ncbi:MAG TPA: hypothetical protein VE988_24720, partial [Gemmataceae bacterium]|nr:hypothetical protein [Gemmataceae bacterium]
SFVVSPGHSPTLGPSREQQAQGATEETKHDQKHRCNPSVGRVRDDFAHYRLPRDERTDRVELPVFEIGGNC